MTKDKYIFAPNRGYCVYCPSNIFRSTHSFENWGISLGVFVQANSFSRIGVE